MKDLRRRRTEASKAALAIIPCSWPYLILLAKSGIRTIHLRRGHQNQVCQRTSSSGTDFASSITFGERACRRFIHPFHGFVYSHVFIDTPDRSDYTRAEFPALEGTCLWPMSVSPLLHEMRGHAHDASADHPDSCPVLGQTATPHAPASPPPREGHLPRSGLRGVCRRG